MAKDFIPDDEFTPDEPTPAPNTGASVPQDVPLSQPPLIDGVTQAANDSWSGKAAQRNYETMVAAAHGDPAAQAAVTQMNLGVAMGTLHNTKGQGLAQKADQALGQEAAEGFVSKLDELKAQAEAAFQAAQRREITPAQAEAVRQRYIVAIDQATRHSNQLKSKGYAEGGTVTPDFIPDDQFQADAPSMQAPDRMPATADLAQATPDFIPDSQFVSDEDKYGTAGQMAKTALEGAASAVTFGASTPVETALGIATPEDISGRRRENPISHGAGQLGGLLGSIAIPGVGAANLLSKAGAGAAELAGLAEATTPLAKIGSAAVKGFTENALFQSGDEVSKMFSEQHPEGATDAVETAMSDIGISGLLGGGIGAAIGTVAPLWKATLGPKVSGVLEALQRRMGGEALASAPAEFEASGLEASDAMKAAMSEHPEARRAAAVLRQSDTTTGKSFQAEEEALRQSASDKFLEATGKTAADVSGYSEAEQGKKALQGFTKEYKGIADPISKEYGEITGKFEKLPLKTDMTRNPYASPTAVTDGIAQEVAQLAEKEGFNSPNSPTKHIVDFVMDRLPKQESIQDLSELGTALRNKTSKDPALFHVGSELRSLLLNAQQRVLGNVIQQESPELFSRYVAVRGRYAQLAKLSDELGANLSIGKFHGPGDFLSTLAEKRSPEEFLKKLSPKGNAEIIPFLAKNFPETLGHIKDNELYQVLKPAVRAGAKKGIHDISVETFDTAFSKLTPEMKELVLPAEAQTQMGSIKEVLRKLNDPNYNFSNSGRTAANLLEHLSGSAVAMASALHGHNPIMSGILGAMTKALGRDVPDAARLGLLKYLGSNAAVDSGGFKAAVDFIHSTLKGEHLLVKGSKALFDATKEVLPSTLMPSERDREKLDKRLQQIQRDPSSLVDVGGQTSHYLPDHGQAVGSTAARVSQYLNAQRPQTGRAAPLDPKVEASPLAKAQYNRTLDIAQQPLIVLDRVQKGTLTPKDVADLQNMYPKLYSRMAQKITTEMVNHLDKDKIIPYNTRMSMSLFLAQPLDSTMTPGAIQSLQMTHAAGQAQRQLDPNAPGSAPKGTPGSPALQKLSTSFQTPLQAREAEKARGK